MGLQQQGRPVDEVVADLEAKRENDVRWADGKTFGMIYDGGPSVHEVAERAARLYLHENALNTRAFPSLGEIQSEVVGWTASLLHGEGVSGFLTSGVRALGSALPLLQTDQARAPANWTPK